MPAYLVGLASSGNSLLFICKQNLTSKYKS